MAMTTKRRPCRTPPLLLLPAASAAAGRVWTAGSRPLCIVRCCCRRRRSQAAATWRACIRRLPHPSSTAQGLRQRPHSRRRQQSLSASAGRSSEWTTTGAEGTRSRPPSAAAAGTLEPPPSWWRRQGCRGCRATIRRLDPSSSPARVPGRARPPCKGSTETCNGGLLPFGGPGNRKLDRNRNRRPRRCLRPLPPSRGETAMRVRRREKLRRRRRWLLLLRCRR